MAGVKQPSDKSYFILPDLGEGVAEAELLDWKVAPGQKVAEHQTIAEMETDKARVEVPSPWAGVIRELLGKPGDIIKVGAKLVTYDTGAPAGAPGEAPARAQPVAEPKKSVPHASPQPAAAPKQEEDAGTVVGSVGGTMAISSRFARRPEHAAVAGNGGKALATPAVRRIAREQGIDIDRVPGSGRGGRVTASDIEAFVRQGASALRAGSEHDRATRRVAPAGSAPPAPSGDGVSQRIPFRGIRRKIAQALRHSVSTTVHFTVVESADVTALEAKRKELVFATGQKLSLLPFLITAVCRALKEHPALNANVDDEKEEIILRNVINLGCAVDTDHGLMVPVIAGADHLSILDLSNRVKDVAERCHNRTIPREELIGGTFTISNVGSYGGMFATPIINYPEVAILAAGRARDEVMARHGGFFLGKSLPLSLSCDHRVVDGAEGTRFLNTVVRYLESPERLLKP